MQNVEETSGSGPKKAYERPEIIDLGTVDEVTKGGVSNSADTLTASNP